MRKDAARAEIDAHIAIRAFVAWSSFGQCAIDNDGIGMAIWLKK